MQIPITNNNSNNGKKLSAGEETETPNYYDAKTFSEENIKRALKESTEDQNEVFNKYKFFTQTSMTTKIIAIASVLIAILTAILFAMFSPESEADKAGRIATLDYKRQEQLKENQATRQATIDCDLAITNEMGKDTQIVPCNSRTHSGATLVPKADASESATVTTNSGTATGATIPVPQRVKSVPYTGKLLTPDQLYGPLKVSDDCYISQTESVHVEVRNGGMFATDLACKFGATGGRGSRAEVYAPDLRNEVVEYTVEYVGYDQLLGSFIQLTYGDQAFYLGHTESKLKIGDKVKTGQRIGQMILNGATTGWHVHFEYRVKNKGGTWASQRYFTAIREKALDNQRKNVMKTDWVWGDKVFATAYDLGDVNQNDASPFIGASGKDLRHVYNPIALTLDVRKALGIKFGDVIVICQGVNCYDATVEDEMNKRYRYACSPREGACIKMDIARPKNKTPPGLYTLMCKKSECKYGQP